MFRTLCKATVIVFMGLAGSNLYPMLAAATEKCSPTHTLSMSGKNAYYFDRMRFPTMKALFRHAGIGSKSGCFHIVVSPFVSKSDAGSFMSRLNKAGSLSNGYALKSTPGLRTLMQTKKTGWKPSSLPEAAATLGQQLKPYCRFERHGPITGDLHAQTDNKNSGNCGLLYLQRDGCHLDIAKCNGRRSQAP